MGYRKSSGGVFTIARMKFEAMSLLPSFFRENMQKILLSQKSIIDNIRKKICF